MTFYVELPADEDGNTSMPLAVVEARAFQGGPNTPPLTNPSRAAMVPSAPAEIVRRWGSGWYADAYGGWAEVEGPARMLTREEYDGLIASIVKKETPQS